jgi:hypothetical protein
VSDSVKTILGAELTAMIENALKQGLKDVAADTSAKLLWASQVAPRIALYADMAARGDVQAAKNLKVLRGVAIAKAANSGIVTDSKSQQLVGSMVVGVGHLAAQLLLKLSVLVATGA